MSNDPLLQPYQLKHLTLRNRVMTTVNSQTLASRVAREDGNSTWFIILPADRSTYQLPQLPTALASAGPQPQDSLGSTVRVFDIFSVADFTGLRALPSSTPMCLECALYAGDISHVVVTP